MFEPPTVPVYTVALAPAAEATETVPVSESTIANRRFPLPDVGFVVTTALTVIESPAATPMNVELTVAVAVSPAAIADFVGVSVNVSPL